MFDHPRIYFEEFERLSEQIPEREHLIATVACNHRLTPQHATEVHHEWSTQSQRQPVTAAGE